MGAAGAPRAAALLWAWAAAAAGWPNALEDFEHGGVPGLLETRKQGVHRNFRRYYRVVALDLLLAHHGLRPCESARGDDEENLETTRGAVQAFQASHGLAVDPWRLDAQFWSSLVVSVRPGDTSSAVLALRWLLDATSRAARPPLWDAAAVQVHGCSAGFDGALLAMLEASASAGACVTNATELNSLGLPQDCWEALLAQPEVTVADACEIRAPVANSFGAVWVTAWLVITVAFAATHLDGRGPGSRQGASSGALDATRLDGKGSASRPGALSGVCHRSAGYLRRVAPLLAMTLCQNLAAIGIWSFPHDLVKLLLVGLLITGGALVLVHLAAVRNRASGWLSTSLLEIFLFTAGNVGTGFVIIALPWVRGLWLVLILASMMVLWGLVTMLLTQQNRAIRGMLLFVMCLLAAAGPTMISIVSGLVNKTGLWLAAFAPTGLLAASMLSERLVGHFIVMHCEYTAETQWLLAIMFRLCIELVRFNTALTVLLLSLVTDCGFWFLTMHLVQTFVFEVAMRLPRQLSEPPKSSSQGHRAPFTAAEIVLRVGAHPWVYRSRAVMFPIEVVLFVSHLCQLVFVGMPAGVDQGWWIFGLALIGLEYVCHEAVGHLLDRCSTSAMPAIPWDQLSGHLLALMAGAGTVMSTFAQFGSLWLVYAHHWAACFIDGGRGADDRATASEADNAVRIATTVVLGVVALSVVIHAFLCWIGLVSKAEAQCTTKAPSPGEYRLDVIVPAEDTDTVCDHPVATISGLSGISQTSHQGQLSQPSPQNSDPSFNSSLKTELGSEALNHSVCSRTWENTLSWLWEEDQQSNSRSPSPPASKPAGASRAPATTAPGPAPAPIADAHLVLSAGLLKELDEIEQDSRRSPTPVEDTAKASASSEEYGRLLRDVLADMPTTPHEEDRAAPGLAAPARGEPAPAPTPPPQPPAPAPARRPEPAISADPVTREDWAEIAEIEAMLRDRVSPRATSIRADPACLRQASKTSTALSQDEVQVFLQRTLNEDDLNGLMAAIPSEREAAGAEATAPEGAAVAAEEVEVAEAEAAAPPAAAAEEAGEGAGAGPEERFNRTLEQLARNEEEAAVAAAATAAAEAAARAAAEEALADAVRQRSRTLIEERLAAAGARGVAEERLAEARRAAAELLAEEQAAAAREASRAEARQKLDAAVRRRSRYSLVECIQEAKALEVSQEVVWEAENVMQDLEEEERRELAARALASACEEEDLHEIRSKLQQAREAAVNSAALAAGEKKLQELELREAARSQLQDALDPRSALALAPQLARLRAALENARAAGVPPGELQVPTESVAALEAQQRREAAAAALAEAFAAQDVERTREALSAARAAGVEEAQVAKVEQGLKHLEEELELAHDKERFLRRKIENAMAAKDTAELATASAEVENMLGEGGVTKALRSVIDEAKKMRLVHRSEVQKAEAVLNEVTADLKRILLAKKKEEQRRAEERLAAEMEAARRERPLRQAVLEALQQAISAARVFDAGTKDAEALLATLTAEHEREKQAAMDGLARALDAMDAAGIRAGVELCRSLLLAETVRSALQQTRGIISSELESAREAEREERLQKLPAIEALINTMRALGDQQLRQFHNDLQDLKGALRVFCRVRPLSNREKQLGDSIAVTVADPFTVSVQGSAAEAQSFSYDAIFGPGAAQPEVFAECRSLVQSAFDGYNVTIFSYGQTGAGKTWTLYGAGHEPGISPRTCEEVFRIIARDSDRLDVDLQASMVELYCNDLRDLLNKAKDPPKLEFRNFKNPDGSLGVRLDGATEVKVQNSEGLAQVVATGLSMRKVKKTNMNADSSRSHLMLVICLEVTDRASGRSRRGKITIVDLAGSERLAKSGVTGEGQREAIEINKSLTALGDVMMAFTSRSKVIPYRNHKLTQLMQDSLGGSAKTLMFVNVSPASSNADETVNALKYASRARCIENEVKRHQSTRAS